jgi:integrase
LAYFGESTRLSNIRYLDPETYQNHLREKFTKSGTVRKEASINPVMACLSHMLNKAVEWEMMGKNPLNRGKSLMIEENNKRLRFLSEGEIKKLLNECPKYLHSIVECALNTGMRKGEILSLKWSQIGNGLIYLDKTKTNEARQIPISDTLKKVLRETRRENQLKSEFVFTYKEKPVKDVKRAFGGALRRERIEDFRFHDLRHTFASHLIMRRATLKKVQELLGHKAVNMTVRYAHLSQEHKQKAVNLLNGLTAPNKETATMSQNVTFR